MHTDYYAILGVSKTSTEAEIKSAYRKLAREWHPDVAKDRPDAEERFKEINEAYQVLGDPVKRKQYDQLGHNAYKQGFGGASGGSQGAGFNPFEGMGGFGPFNWSYQSGGDQDFQDPFDIFEQVFGFRGFGGSRKGRNLRYTMSIDFVDSVKGYENVVEVNGHKLKVKTPPGVDDGTTIKYVGKGEKSQHGGDNGDLLITIHINPHKKFARQGDDLFSNENITLKEAAVGGKIDIEVVDPNSNSGFSKKQLKIPSGTQSGTVFRVKGFGMPNPKGYGRGDLYVTVHVEIPTKLTKQQKEALIEYF